MEFLKEANLGVVAAAFNPCMEGRGGNRDGAGEKGHSGHLLWILISLSVPWGAMAGFN